MELDKIVVLLMALGFFGGLAYVIWKGKQHEQRPDQGSLSTRPDQQEVEAPNKSRKKQRKIPKS